MTNSKKEFNYRCTVRYGDSEYTGIRYLIQLV